MAAQFDLVPGFDPTGLPNVTAIQLYNMVAQAYGLPNIGGVIKQSTPPDVVNNPRFKKYIWVDDTDEPPLQKVWDEDAQDWVNNTVDVGSVNNSKISDVSILKLSLEGIGAPQAGQLLRVNSTEDGIELWTLELADNSVDLSKIALINPGEDQVLQYRNGALSLQTLDVIDLIPANSLGVNKLASGPNNSVLATVNGVATWTNSTEAIIADDSIALDKLNDDGVANYAVIRKKTGAGTGFETAVDPKIHISSALTLNPGGIVTSNHGLGGIPDQVIAFAECIDAVGNYAVGQRFQISATWGGGGDRPAVSVWSSTTQVGVTLGNANVTFLNRTTGAFVTVSAADFVTYFKAVIVATKFNRS